MPPSKVVLKSGEPRWEVRYYEAGRGSPRRTRRFLLKGDAEAFEREMLRRRQLGELAESGGRSAWFQSSPLTGSSSM